MTAILMRSQLSTPNLPQLYKTNERLRNTVVSGDSGLRSTILTNRIDLLTNQFRHSVPLAKRRFAKANAIGPVVFSGSPIKIFRAIVGLVSILVKRKTALSRTVEDFANRTMNHDGAADTVFGGSKLKIANGVAHKCYLSPANTSRAPSAKIAPGETSDSALVGNFVDPLIVGDRSPFFGIIDISHSAVPSHCGQGRALLTQRFRPELCRGKTEELQAKELIS